MSSFCVRSSINATSRMVVQSNAISNDGNEGNDDKEDNAPTMTSKQKVITKEMKKGKHLTSQHLTSFFPQGSAPLDAQPSGTILNQQCS